MAIGNSQNLYTEIWKAALDLVLDALSGDASKSYRLRQEVFERVGNRKSYGFRTEFRDGKCTKCTNSAVARDLVDVVERSARFKELCMGKSVVIRMSNSFVFSIECLSSDVEPNGETRDLSLDAISSFPPVVDEASEILVLGTMPGSESLSTGEYYAQRGNVFWKLISRIYNKGEAWTTYEEKMDCLKRYHIALWDTLATCQRKGGADAGIRNEVRNDIDAFLEQYPTIKKIVFNGERPLRYYTPRIPHAVALSTSPSNNKYSEELRLASWRKALAL